MSPSRAAAAALECAPRPPSEKRLSPQSAPVALVPHHARTSQRPQLGYHPCAGLARPRPASVAMSPAGSETLRPDNDGNGTADEPHGTPSFAASYSGAIRHPRGRAPSEFAALRAARECTYASRLRTRGGSNHRSTAGEPGCGPPISTYAAAPFLISMTECPDVGLRSAVASTLR